MYLNRDIGGVGHARNDVTPTIPAEKYLVSNIVNRGYWETWMDFTFPYIKSLQVFDCPSHQHPIEVPLPGESTTRYTNPPLSFTLPTKVHFASLSYNGVIGGFWTPKPDGTMYGTQAAKLATMKGVSQKIFATHNPYWVYGYMNAADYHNKGVAADSADRRSMFPHSDGTVLLFCDGHAKWTPRTAVEKWTCSDTISDYNGYQFDNTATTGSVCGYWNPMVEPPD
jgi:prepilin-type processing-associated H-X9-DG protein